MSGFIAATLFQTVAMLLTAALLPGLKITSFLGALGIVIALALVNSTIWDAALFFQIPTTLTQHTIVLLCSNALLFWIVAKLLPGIELEGFISALLAPIIFTVLTVVVHQYGREVDWKKVGQVMVQEVGSLRDYLKESQPAPAPGPDAAPTPEHNGVEPEQQPAL